MTKKSVLKNIPDITSNFRLEKRKVSELKIPPNHPRKRTEWQREKSAGFIDANRLLPPPLIDAQNNIILGHEFIDGANLVGLEQIDVLVVEGLSEAQIRSARIGYYKIIEKGEWDIKILADEIKDFIDLKIDLRGIAFETPEIDLIISKAGPSESEMHENTLPEQDPAAPVISQVGDLWLLGKHKLLCASATEKPSYKMLMGNELASAAISDPPYNVPNAGFTGGKGNKQHDNFIEGYGEKSEGEFIKFLALYLTYASHYMKDGGLIYSFMDWRHQYELITAYREAGLHQLNLIFWNKSNGAMGSFYRSKHELIYVLKKGGERHINNVQLGKHGRYRTNVWDYAGVNTFGNKRMEELSMHPTVKPVALIADAVLDCTNLDDIILDPFSGSGTIFIGCEKTGRRAYGIELDPRYVDTAIRRWQNYTGQKAIHVASKMNFDERECEVNAEGGSYVRIRKK